METIKICKDRDLLKQYLTEHEQEVRNIMVTLFDNETILKGYTMEKVNAARFEGQREGRKEGEKRKAIETAKKMLSEALPLDLIARISGLTPSEIDDIKANMTN